MNENKNSRKRYWVGGGLVLAVTAVIAAFALGNAESAAAQTQTGETTAVFVGDLADTASASGQIVAQDEASLSFNGSGTVGALYVAVGDVVESGAVLAQLETATLASAVASSEQDVLIAEAELATLYADPTAAELTAAEASLASSQAALADLLAEPTEAELAAEEAKVAAAQANLWSAAERRDQTLQTGSEADILTAQANLEDAREGYQAAYESWVRAADCEEDGNGGYVCTTDDSDRSVNANLNLQAATANLAAAEANLEALQNPDYNNVNSAQASVGSAQAAYDAAVAKYELFLTGATATQIAAAEANVASAEASLAKLVAEPAGSTIKTYETRLAQAKTNLAVAQNALADATLVAPFDGIVIAVNISPGEQASGSAITIIDTDSYEVVVNVDEVDVGTIAIGQMAELTFESWPGETVSSEVVSIAPVSSTSASGIVSYEVRLALGESDLTIRDGMTANADLITAERDDVLLIENAAIRADRSSGQYFANVVSVNSDGEQQFTEVELFIGLNDGEYTQIIEGLAEGDEVLVGQLEVAEDGGGPFGR